MAKALETEKPKEMAPVMETLMVMDLVMEIPKAKDLEMAKQMATEMELGAASFYPKHPQSTNRCSKKLQ
jgi:hypothetical protein